MHFELNEDQAALAEGVRRFLTDSYAFDQRQKALAARDGFDRGRWQELAALGTPGLCVREDAGGLGQSLLEATLVQAELARALVIEPVAEAMLAALLVDRHASPSVRASLLPELVSGDQIAVLAHTEQDSDGLAHNLTTKAERKDGQFRLNGAKSVVIGAAEAHVLLVSALTGDGPVLLAVPRNTPGVSLRPLELTDDRWAADVTFVDVVVDEEALIGRGAEAVAEAFDLARLMACAQMVGAMEQALALTTAYLPVRRQFGQALADFQALRHRLADMYVELEQGRSALYAGLSAALFADAGERYVAACAAKAQVGFAARTVCGLAIQLHGGIGMTEEYAVGHMFRRASVADLLLGNADAQLALLADAMLAEQERAEPALAQSVDSSQSRNRAIGGVSH